MGCNSCRKAKEAGVIFRKLKDSILHEPQVDDVTLNLRRSICSGCDRSTKILKKFTSMSSCKECGCFIYLKSKLLDEVCPLERW